MESDEDTQKFFFNAERNTQQKIPVGLRMAMQAAVDMGLSEHYTGQLFNVPSVSRLLKELRILQQIDQTQSQQLDTSNRQALQLLNQKAEAQAQIVAIAKISKALAEGQVVDQNVKRLSKTVSKETNAQFALLPPEVGEALFLRIEKSS